MFDFPAVDLLPVGSHIEYIEMQRKELTVMRFVANLSINHARRAKCMLNTRQVRGPARQVNRSVCSKLLLLSTPNPRLSVLPYETA